MSHTLPRYWRRVAADRWVVTGTTYALEQLADGTFQFYSCGHPAFTVTSLSQADQALADLLDAESAS